VTRFRTPWDEAPEPAWAGPDASLRGPAPPKRRGRRPAAGGTAAPVAAGVSPWLRHHLEVSGPDAALAVFVAAARGPGTVPWRHGPAGVEEDALNLLLAQPAAERTLSAAGCRILARQVGMAVEARHAQAVARAGQDRACPLDLHALLPVPDALLGRGPDDPEALGWMRAHWGVTAALRHPARQPGATAGPRPPAGCGAAGWSFCTEGGTPHAAVAQLRLRWPALQFDLAPRAGG
jgi:hypothetical protein